jgi:hypothetical protein
MDEERREVQRFTTRIIGQLRNLTQNTDPRVAILTNLSKGGFLLEMWQKVKLQDSIEFRVQEFTLVGEVIHYLQEGDKWLVGVRTENRLNDGQLRRILEAS